MDTTRSDFYVASPARAGLVQRSVLWLTLAAMVAQPVNVSAQVIAASAGSYRPQVDSAANGVPLIQITSPSAAGVSRNQYQQFDVAARGVVLNNSRTIVQTQLAGFTAGNPNLAAATARIIVSEVTSSLPSSLRGYTEVGGARAEVIIANPNGITCDGCGFINASRGVLTTGSPVFGAGGSLDALRVVGGQISVDGAGLNASNIDQIDLIARAVKVNAGLWGQALNIVGGAGQVAYTDLSSQTIAGDGAAPAVSIDVAQLGGMYAGKIRLVGSEAGVGVVNAGTLAAQAGELAIDSAGRITLAGKTQARGRIDLVARQAIDHSGSLYGQQDVSLASGGMLSNSGSLVAQRSLDIAAASVDSGGTLAAGADAQGALAANGALHVATIGNLRAVGGNLAGGDLVMSGASLDLTGAQSNAGGALTLNALSGDMRLGGGILQSAGDLYLNAAGTISNDQGRVLAGQNLMSRSAGFSNRNGQLLQNAGGSSQIVVSDVFDNRAGIVAGNGVTTLAVGQLDNRAGTVQAQRSANLSIAAAGHVDNGAGGLLAAGGTFTLTADELANVEGKISADVDGKVTSAGTFDNRQGSFVATRDLALSAQAIDNRGGIVGAVSGSTTASTGGMLDNGGGRIEAAQALDLAATGLLNESGVLIGKDLRIDTRQQTFVNIRGQLVAGGTLTIDSGALANDSGLIQASEALAIDTHGQALSNTDSAGRGILGESSVTLAAGALDNRHGVIASLGTADLDLAVSGRVDNGAGGLLVAGRTLRLAAGELVNAEGQVSAVEDLSIASAQTIDNREGTIAAARNVAVDGQAINNGGGAIGALSGSATVNVGGWLDNSGGRLWAGADSRVSAGAVANAGGRLYAARDLGLGSGSLSGDGILLADRDLTLTLGGAYTQSAGNTIKANRKLNLTLDGALVNQGTLSAVDQLSVGASSIDNQSGASFQAASARLAASQFLANSGAIWANSLSLAADTLDNSGSVYGQDITVNARILNNQGSGVIAAGNALSLYVGASLANVDGGLLYSSGRLSIAADASRDGGGWLANPTGYLLNRSAGIEARGDLELSAAVVDNRRTSAVTATRSVSSSTTLEQLCDGGWGGCGSVKFINGTYVTVDTSTETCNSKTQQCSTSESSKNYLAGWYGIETHGRYFDASSLGTVITGPVEKCSLFDCTRVTTTETVSVPDPWGEWAWGPAAGSVETFTLRSGVKQEVPYERRRVVLSERLQDIIVSATPEARLLAGGNLYLRAGSVNNTASRIEASSNLVAAVTTLNNTGTTLYDRTHETIWHGGCSDIKDDTAGSLGSCASGWLWTAMVSDSITGSNSSLDAIFRGGQALTLSAITVNNRSVDAQGLTPGGVNLSAAGRVSAIAPSSAAYAATPRAMTPFVFASASGGLYTLRAAPGAPYLVETDPRFTQYSSFISSDYMLGRLGLDPAAVHKRLGDGYYEQQLVRDQIINLRGQASLGAYASLDAEYLALLDAGAAYAREFSIVPGVSLTQQQIAALAHDLVWLEMRVVDGQEVLVPVVHLAQDTSATPGPSGAVIDGGLSTQVDAVDVNNSGAIIASGATNVVASHDIINDSGHVGGKSVVLAAGNDLHLGTATRSVSVAPGQTFTYEGFSGTVEGQRVSLSADRDLTLAGGRIKAGDATLSAGRDLAIGTQTVSSEQRAAAGGSRYERSTSAELSSRIDASGELTLAAKHDLTVAGSRVESGGDLNATAGNNLTVSAAKATDRVDYESHSDEVNATLQSATSRTQASTLTAAGGMTLTAGATLASEGATLRASGDVALEASRIVLDAAYDGAQRSASHSAVGKYTQQQMREQSSSQSARGTVVAAGGDLTIKSAGDTLVVGGALAAGQALRLESGGDLALLTAQSQSASHIDASGRDSRKATALKYSDEETRQLLTTLAAGTSLALAVGGDFRADVGEKNADGTLRADRMTADGIVKGDSRQQVSVTHSGVGANANPTRSKVRGDLTSQGIRNGANDAFTPGATRSSTTALEQYLSSGLVQVKNEPVIAGEIKRILQGDGATLSIRDANGKVSLSVAGQAKIQDVYNTLKLSESFDEKHFANAGIAQAVTLVAAIALTAMTAGAGTASIGAVMAGGVGTTSTMINAAMVAMASTMTGQLAGGASFDDAFQAGIKAGAVAAVSAGIASGVSEYVNGTTAGTPTTINSAGQQVQVGSNGANGVTNLNRLGTTAYWQQTALNATAQGALAKIQGGSFQDGLAGSAIGSLSATGAGIIGDTTVGMPVTNVVAHAVLGCASAAASGKDCATGALGGSGSAIFAPIIDSALSGSDLSRATQDAIVAGGSIAGSMAFAGAFGKDTITAGNAAANEVTNNYLTNRQISEKQAELAKAANSEERQKITSRYATVDAEQRKAAAACLVGETCGSVMDPRTVKAVLNELNASCAPPRLCSADAKAGITELNELYAKTEALGGVYSIEEWVLGGKIAGTALNAVKAILSGAAGVEARTTGIAGVNSGIGKVTNVRAISAEEANAPFVAKGWSPPYDTGSQVRTFTTTSEVQFVRVSTIDNTQGAFLVRANEIYGMTPEQIKQYLALPKTPTQIADVTVPAGTNMQVGWVSPQPKFGVASKGGIQYQLLNPIPSSSFGKPRLIK